MTNKSFGGNGNAGVFHIGCHDVDAPDDSRDSCVDIDFITLAIMGFCARLEVSQLERTKN